MTAAQRLAVYHLSKLFGNAGPCHTMGNHHFIHSMLYGGDKMKSAGHYQPTQECVKAYESVMRGDWSGLNPKVRVQVMALEEKTVNEETK